MTLDQSFRTVDQDHATRVNEGFLNRITDPQAMGDEDPLKTQLFIQEHYPFLLDLLIGIQELDEVRSGYTVEERQLVLEGATLFAHQLTELARQQAMELELVDAPPMS